MNESCRFNVSQPPEGWRRLLALGPGLIWSASAVGVGSLVFATRAFSIAMTYFSALFFLFFIILLFGAVLRAISFSI